MGTVEVISANGKHFRRRDWSRQPPSYAHIARMCCIFNLCYLIKTAMIQLWQRPHYMRTMSVVPRTLWADGPLAHICDYRMQEPAHNVWVHNLFQSFVIYLIFFFSFLVIHECVRRGGNRHVSATTNARQSKFTSLFSILFGCAWNERRLPGPTAHMAAVPWQWIEVLLNRTTTSLWRCEKKEESQHLSIILMISWKRFNACDHAYPSLLLTLYLYLHSLGPFANFLWCAWHRSCKWDY